MESARRETFPNDIRRLYDRGTSRIPGTLCRVRDSKGIPMNQPPTQRRVVDGTMARDLATPSLPDGEILARVLAGEPQLFEVLIRRHNQKVFRAARAIVGRDDEAEDVMQDAYVRAYAHLAAFRGDASFATWVTRIAVHEALARVRRERRFAPRELRSLGLTSTCADRLTNPEEQASGAELRQILDRAIDALPEDLRLTFVLRTVEQMSSAETAEILSIPEQTVNTRLFRARERLRHELLVVIDANLAEAYNFHLTRCDRVVAAVFARLARVMSS